MTDKPVILILEDDKDLADEINFALSEASFETVVCHTVRSFWRYVSHREIDLMVVDLSLPDGYGLDVIREVRSNSDVPIIIASGRAAIEERVAGIELGADDYLGKPYNTREVIAKASRLLSRTRGSQFSSRISRLSGREVYLFNGFELDAQAMSLNDSNGAEIAITTYEFLILKALVEHSNVVLSRASLVDFVYSDNSHGSERTVDNLVSRIRSKLSEHSKDTLIKTVRGIGYVFTGNVTSEKR